MNDVIANWLASPSSGVLGYTPTWSQNGTVVGTPTMIPSNSGNDASGYSSDFSTATGITPGPGDVITCLLVVNGTGGLNGPVQTPTPSSITIPTVPVAPQPAPGFTLTLS